MARADFLTGLVLFALGMFMIAEGVRLPGAGGLIEAGGEPGRVPIFLGAVIGILALVLILRSTRQGGHRLSLTIGIDADRRGAVRRAVITAAGCSFYAVGLISRSFFGVAMPYEVATFLFMLAFIVISEWELAPGIGPRRWRQVGDRAPALAEAMRSLFAFVPPRQAPFVWLVFTAALQAAVITAAVTYVFREQFYVTLP